MYAAIQNVYQSFGIYVLKVLITFFAIKQLIKGLRKGFEDIQSIRLERLDLSGLYKYVEPYEIETRSE